MQNPYDLIIQDKTFFKDCYMRKLVPSYRGIYGMARTNLTIETYCNTNQAIVNFVLWQMLTLGREIAKDGIESPTKKDFPLYVSEMDNGCSCDDYGFIIFDDKIYAALFDDVPITSLPLTDELWESIQKGGPVTLVFPNERTYTMKECECYGMTDFSTENMMRRYHKLKKSLNVLDEMSFSNMNQ
jgi:hypothetical protein